MRIAMESRYHGPTNTRGARISVRRMERPCQAVFYSYSGLASSGKACYESELHREAVEDYAKKKGWAGTLVAGGTARGYVWVWVEN